MKITSNTWVWVWATDGWEGTDVQAHDSADGPHRVSVRIGGEAVRDNPVIFFFAEAEAAVEFFEMCAAKCRAVVDETDQGEEE